MIFLTLIPHGNFEGLSPTGQVISLITGFVLFMVGYGIYLTFGAGGEELRDPIDEHAKMHELGIAHGHEGKKPILTQRAQEQDYPQHHHDD